MNISQIESNVQNVLQNLQQDAFIYEFILAYGLPKATAARLQKGGLNLSKYVLMLQTQKDNATNRVNGLLRLLRSLIELLS
ncbi:MAG: hypothetical protein U5L45_11400 [Saprospiraceae bacterium]|nr:hypothetical protein [Saprospiraceae bacterium]